MTPFANTVSIPVANKIPQNTAKQSSAAVEQDEKSLRAKKDTDTSSSLFDELIASLLTRQAPAQPQPLQHSPASSDGTFVSAITDFSPTAGTGFSMEPALLVMPQDLSDPLSGIQTATGDFTSELLSAMTPGLPQSVPSQGDAVPQITAPVSVPVPVADSTPATDALTISPVDTTETDPRLVACGFSPADMASLKEKFAGHPQSQPVENSVSPTVSQTNQPANTAPAAPVETDTGIITVTFSPPSNDKGNAQVPTPATPLANSAVALHVAEASRAFVTQTQTTTPVATSTPAATQSIAADAGLSFDMMLDGMSEEINGTATLPAEGEATDSSTSFDPVEFRIAQRFQNNPSRPVSSPQTPGTISTPASAANNAAVTNSPNNGANNTAVSNATINTNASMPPATDQGMTLDTAFLPTDLDFTSMVATPSGIPQGVTSPLSSPVSQNVMASQSHPAIHAAAAAIIKGAKSEGAQTLSLRLDPPELGRLQVEMKYKKGDPLKVHVVLEKSDTVSMFQRDAHALENALKDAGLQTDGTSLSFSLAQDNNSFGQAMGQNGGDNAPLTLSGDKTETAADSATLATDLDVYTDSRTGITHYNLRV